MSKFEGVPHLDNPEQNGELETQDVAGQAEQDLENSFGNRLVSPEKIAGQNETGKITNVIGRINEIEELMCKAQISTDKNETQIKKLRESMGLSPESAGSPISSRNVDSIAVLSAERDGLIKQREEWVRKFGRDNLPEGLVLGEGENGRETKGVQPLFEGKLELTDKEKQEQTKERKEWLEAWENDAVAHFEKVMGDDRRTKNAINFDLTIEVMKVRVPDAMEREMKGFVDGTSDELPSAVWIHWECNSLFDHIMGKPNVIKKLEITFEDEVVILADEKDLEKKDEKTEESKSEEKPKKKTPNESMPGGNPVEGRNTESPKA